MSNKKKNTEDEFLEQDENTEDKNEPVTGDKEDIPLEEESSGELLDRLRRLGADYQNYRKRVQKEMSSMKEFANESLIREILPVLDDMELAMESKKKAQDDDDPLLEGMRLVHGKLLAVLEKQGLCRIETEGEEFDPEKHSAIMQEESDVVSPGTVLKELQAGYTLKSRTIRAAKVVVSRAVEPEVKDDEKKGSD